MKLFQLWLVAVQIFSWSFSPLASARETVSNARVAWEYDPGPNPADPMQKELIDLIASMPHMPGISEQILGEQKFRLIFGPVFWRMLLNKNSMKILFIGQDATHIAEAAERTATAGFGGRAQDLANYLGVDRSAGFINTYAYTIYGQAAAFNTPYIYTDANGNSQARFVGFVENPLWLMTYDQRSAATQWRNRLIDWIIRNNRDSLRLIVAFGGAARDAIGAFIESKGGQVGSRVSPDQLSSIKVPLIKTVPAGGNNEFPVLLDREGNDLYAKLVGRPLDYKKLADQQAAQKTLESHVEEALRRAAITGGGNQDSGIIHPAQLGGYNLSKIEIRGRTTRNIRRLVLSDGREIGRDLAVSQFPHPTALSSMKPEEAAEAVRNGLEDVKEFAREIPADPGFVNQFAQGHAYRYGRASIGPEFYSFGTPLSRQVSVSSAVRMRGKPNVIVFGTRDEVDFGTDIVEKVTNMKPAEAVPPGEIFTSRPRLPETRYQYDLGPGARWARLMKENLDLDALFKTKPGKTWERNGIDAYNVKTGPDHGDFGHYRGTFENPRVLILADPDGVDDLITSRALTGMRGQYLQGLMNDLGVGEEHLIIKTVPFGMDGASGEEWQTVLAQTKIYRDRVVGQLLEKKLDLILTDGNAAAAEMDRLVKAAQIKTPVVNIQREGLGNNSGLIEAGRQIARLPGFKGVRVSGQRAHIPRTHLTFYAHVWEGTSGDSVISAKQQGRGNAFALIAPAWAYKQKVELDAVTQRSIDALRSALVTEGLYVPGEDIAEFMRTRGFRGNREPLRQAN